MSYKLKTVLDELEGAGMITTDEELVIGTLNNDLGLNIHHDLVIDAEEKQVLKTALIALQILALEGGDDVLLGLAERALKILEI